MTKKNEIAKTTGGGLTVSSTIEEQLAGLDITGNESVGAEDIALPIIRILQKLSPQLDEQDSSYVEGAKSGHLYNTVSKTSHAELTVVPIGYSKGYIEYVPRDSGGGFVAKYSAGHPIISQAQKVGNKLVLPNGNELVETHEQYIRVIDSDNSYIALLPMSSTQITVSKHWNTAILQRTFTKSNGETAFVPRFAQLYTLSTEPKSNNFGSWSSIKFEFKGIVDDPTLLEQATADAKTFEETLEKAVNSYATASAPSENTAADAVASAMK